MKVYFLSSRPCILTLNGAYFGLTDTFERSVDISPADNLFAQFTPENGLPVQFFLNENIRFHPPKGCEIYLLKNGLAVYAKDFPPSDLTLKTIAQEREDKTLVTVFRQGEIQLSIERSDGFFLATLPPSFEKTEITFYEEFLLLNSQTELAVFNLKGKLLLLEKVNEFRIQDNELVATLPLSDLFFRTAECKWRFESDTLVQTAFSITQRATFELGLNGRKSESTPASENIRDEILPYAFFESVLIGADYSHFLCDELKEKSNALKEFLGEYGSVVLTKNPRVCGLVRKKAERLFEVDEYAVEIVDGKITDVRNE
jgi:hypothetical protein